MKTYPRFITPTSQPFDPLELAKETERIVTRDGPEGLERKYIGIACSKGRAVLFKKGKKIGLVEERDYVAVLMREIESM